MAAEGLELREGSRDQCSRKLNSRIHVGPEGLAPGITIRAASQKTEEAGLLATRCISHWFLGWKFFPYNLENDKSLVFYPGEEAGRTLQLPSSVHTFCLWDARMISGKCLELGSNSWR